jgi:hypothetical protein
MAGFSFHRVRTIQYFFLSVFANLPLLESLPFAEKPATDHLVPRLKIRMSRGASYTLFSPPNPPFNPTKADLLRGICKNGALRLALEFRVLCFSRASQCGTEQAALRELVGTIT